jgi:tetratricopeptide (TPR) repeat protein
MEADDYASAIPCFEEALAISHSLKSPNLPSRAGILSALGIAYSAANDFAKSVQLYEEAIAIERENDSINSIVISNLNDLARLYLHPQHQDYPKALSLFEEALMRTRGEGDKQAEYYQLLNTAFAFSQANHEQAMNYAEQALALARQTGDHRTVDTSLKTIGELYFRAANYEQAIKIFMDVLALERQNNESLAESQTLMRLSGMHKQIGNAREAAGYMKQGLLLQANNDNYRDSFSQIELARILEDEGDLAAALDYAQRALNYFIEQQASSDDTHKQNFEYWVKMAQDRIASIRQKLDTSDI